MVKAGFTVRHAARRVGISHGAVQKTRDCDRAFAVQLAAAEQERDQAQVAQIHNAGQKSWRAAAWLLERTEPKEYSLRHKTADPWSHRGQRRLKNLVAGIVNQTLIDCLEVHKQNPDGARADKRTGGADKSVNDRLAAIESLLRGYDPLGDDDEDEDCDDSLDAQFNDADAPNSEPSYQQAGARHSADPQPDDDADETDDASEQERLAADEAYERLRSLLRGQSA